MDFFDQMEARIPRGEVRTRFAPSPTGYMHIGNLRTALYTWLIARRAGGKFILRIEDTDQGRLVEGAVDVIYNTMAQCGLDHDEGPDVGGPVGPYIQSQRQDLFGKYAELLVKKGGAYYCFCQKSDDGTAPEGGARRHEAYLQLPPAEPRRKPRKSWRAVRPTSSARRFPAPARRRSTISPLAISPWRIKRWRTRSC